MLELIKFLGGAALIIGALVYIAKRVVDGFLQTGVARFRANLEKTFKERLIKFEHLHHERATVVCKLYQCITELDIALSSTLHPFRWAGDISLSDKVKNLVKLHNKFNDFYQSNKIFFSADTCAKLDNLVSASRDVCVDIQTFPIDPRDDEYKHNKEALKERRDCWEKARNLHKNEMREIRKEIEKEFRDLLGVAV